MKNPKQQYPNNIEDNEEYCRFRVEEEDKYGKQGKI